MNRNWISAGLLALTLAPWAIAQDNTATGTTGTVVFFRESKFVGGGMSYKVRENGVEICKLKNGFFCSVQVPVGKHSYDVHSEAKDVLNMEVESGETYYVIGTLSVGVLAGHPNLSPSTKDVFDGLKAKLKDNIDRSVMMVTALSPVIGYNKAAEISYYAIARDLTLKQAALAKGVSEDLYDKVVNPLALTRGGSADLPSGPGQP